MNFIWLIFAHYIGDVGFMNKWFLDFKSRSLFILLAHSIIWAGCICIALEYLGLFCFWKAIFLTIGHFLIDLWKSRSDKKYAKPIDELMHFIQLAVVFFI